MPYTFNGCGTTVYQGRGQVGWGSFDAVEWLVLFFLPIAPLRAVHTFGWKNSWGGQKFQCVPLRWSAVLVLRSFLRPWRLLLIASGLVALFFGTLLARTPPNQPGGGYGEEWFFLFVALLTILGLILYVLLAVTDRRTNDIRRVIGPYQLGSCDPALMKKPMNPDPRETFGADAYADAVPALLDAQRYSRAMWAARLSTAWEDPAVGEELTDQVLRHPGVPEALEKVRRKPGCWAEVMQPPAERPKARRLPATPAAEAPSDAPPLRREGVVRPEEIRRGTPRPSGAEKARPIRGGEASLRKAKPPRRIRDEYDAAPRSNRGLIIGLIVGGALLAVGVAAGGATLLYVLVFVGKSATGGASPAPASPAPTAFTPAPKVFKPATIPSSFIIAHGLPVQYMVLNHDGTVIASADQQMFKLWEPFEKNHKPLASFTVKRNPVSSLAFTPDGTQMAVGYGGDALELRDGRTGNLLHVRPVHLSQGADATGAAIPDRRSTRCLAFSADGKVLAAGRGGDVYLWDVEAGKQQRLLKAHGDAVQALAYSPDGKTLATAGRDNVVKLWDTDTWAERFVLRGHTKDVRALSFSPDGTRLASAGSDALVIVWEAAGHTGAVLSVAYSGDGKRLATGSADATLRLWDAAAFAERWQIRHPDNGAVEAVAFDPHGDTLFATYSGMIQRWDVPKLLGP
jgi:WD domain, G-beta repeat